MAPGEPEPTNYWLSNLPPQTPLRELVGLAKIRWRIEPRAASTKIREVLRPRDKAKVEVGVQIVERRIAASLRNHRFSSPAEANAAIRGRLEWLNNRPFAKLDGTRTVPST